MSRMTSNPAGNTKGQHTFARVPSVEIPRSVFNRSHGHKTTFYTPYLIPVFADEALPGDTMRMKPAYFCRMATPWAPVMDNFFLDVFFFAVPMRLIWSNWEKFNGAQVDPGDSTTFLCPQMTQTVQTGELSDYLGIPVDTANDLTFNSFWHRAYNLIWNEYFRDQNLQDSVVVDLDDGPDDPADYVLLPRGKRHDYFSSCLPFLQKGTAVDLPLGTSAPIIGTGTPTFDGNGITDGALRHGATTSGSPTWTTIGITGTGTGGSNLVTWNDPQLEADLSTATAATINQLREAFQAQRLLERDARGGTRYTEIVRSHFGVVSPDARLQRPEFLGGGSTRINVTAVATTSQRTATGLPYVGELAGFVTGFSEEGGFLKSFTEHCVLLGLVNVRADITYQQGVERMFHRQTRFDFYWPTFAHLGEQAVLSQEIYADGSANDTDVFGYQERYAEYRYKPSRVSGVFRSAASGAEPSLDFWHLALDFESRPTLNDTFIQDAPPFDRVSAVTTQPSFLIDCHFDYQCARPMPTFSVPGLIDHF